VARPDFSTALLYAFATLALVAGAARAEMPRRDRPDGQVVLGTAHVNNRMERFDFKVNRQDGDLSEIRFRAGDAPVLIQAIVIVYADGDREQVNLMDSLRPGEQSRPVPIQERRRIVTQVIVSKRPDIRRGETTVQLIGVPRRGWDGGGPVAGDPSERVVSRSSVEGRFDEIPFRVGPDKGPIGAIKFRAFDRGFLMSRVEIVTLRGERKVVDLLERVRPGQTSAVIDLGRPEMLESVTLWKRPSWRPGPVDIDLIGISPPEPPPPRWGGRGPDIPRGWVLFGAQEVAFRTELDIIPVGPEVGRFDRIALKVSGNDVYLREITIVYANGERDQRIIETEIPAGSQTRPIDLSGDRFIREIELVYRSGRDSRRPAVVEVFGDYADEWLGDRGGHRDFNRGWLMLGAASASFFTKDTDTIQVNERVGRIQALRITARRASVRFYGARVFYENGEVEDIPITGALVDGATSQPIDLRGRGRRVDRIQLRYRSKLDFKGQGIVEVWGLT
jgi:hypothetical protein